MKIYFDSELSRKSSTKIFRSPCLSPTKTFENFCGYRTILKKDMKTSTVYIPHEAFFEFMQHMQNEESQYLGYNYDFMHAEEDEEKFPKFDETNRIIITPKDRKAYKRLPFIIYSDEFDAFIAYINNRKPYFVEYFRENTRLNYIEMHLEGVRNYKRILRVFKFRTDDEMEEIARRRRRCGDTFLGRKRRHFHRRRNRWMPQKFSHGTPGFKYYAEKMF